jgi:Tfp pilus assembly protein PilF
MTIRANRAGRVALKSALLGSIALIASGCAADWSYQNLSSRLDRQTVAGAVDPYETGKTQYADGLYGMALKNFRIALVREPKSIDRLNAVAATYDKLGRYDLSERYYANALAVDPKSVLTLNNVGYSFLMQKDYVSARYYLEQAATVARGDGKYNDIVGANLVSLDMAEGRALASLQRPIHTETANASMEASLQDEIAVNKNEGQVHAIATMQDAAKVAAAGVTPTVAGGNGSAAAQREDAVLVPAALPGPKVVAAPVAKVETERLEAPVARPAAKQLAVPAELVIEVSNGNGRRHMAARTRQYLRDQGVPVARITNAKHFGFEASTIFYREGYGERARALAEKFPVPFEFREVENQYAHVRLRFGSDALDFDSQRVAARTGS